MMIPNVFAGLAGTVRATHDKKFATHRSTKKDRLTVAELSHDDKFAIKSLLNSAYTMPLFSKDKFPALHPLSNEAGIMRINLRARDDEHSDQDSDQEKIDDDKQKDAGDDKSTKSHDDNEDKENDENDEKKEKEDDKEKEKEKEKEKKKDEEDSEDDHKGDKKNVEEQEDQDPKDSNDTNAGSHGNKSDSENSQVHDEAGKSTAVNDKINTGDQAVDAHTDSDTKPNSPNQAQPNNLNAAPTVAAPDNVGSQDKNLENLNSESQNLANANPRPNLPSPQGNSPTSILQAPKEPFEPANSSPHIPNFESSRMIEAGVNQLPPNNGASANVNVPSITAKSSNNGINPTIIKIAASAGGSLILLVIIIYTVRCLFRKRRIGKAESPPPSPLIDRNLNLVTSTNSSFRTDNDYNSGKRDNFYPFREEERLREKDMKESYGIVV